MTIRWLFRAVEDLGSVFEYIAADNPAAAGPEIGRVMDAVALLTDHPALGRPGRVPGTRELVVAGAPYIAAYRARTGRIEILHVLHGAPAVFATTRRRSRSGAGGGLPPGTRS